MTVARDAMPAPLMTAAELDTARRSRGFMPEAEGVLLHRAGLRAARDGVMLEVGSYCGTSALYLGSAARACGGLLISVDHHRGSEEQQPGQQYCDPAVVDPVTGRVDTLPHFRRTVADAGLDDVVIGVVASSRAVTRWWRTPLALLFIDGGHTEAAAHEDYDGFAPHLQSGGLLVLHDVFPDPADGGQAPFHVYERALRDGFSEVAAEGSMRVLVR